jgi:hypothetical protein
MLLSKRLFTAAAFLCAGASLTHAADIYGLTEGKAELQSAGSLAFGPDGILFIGDAKAATVVAVQTGDKVSSPATTDRTIENLSGQVADLLKVDAAKLTINDLVVNPKSGTVYLSATADGKPAVVAVDGGGKLSQVNLDKIAFAKSELSNPPKDGEQGEGRRRGNPRNESITDLAFVDGQVLVSGLSASGSTVRSVLFPFSASDKGSGLEIYHGAHGQLESLAPIRTFVPFVIDGQPHVLAGFVCTPLVKFPVKAIGEGEKVKGTTVAELGNRNRPLDMIAYKKDGKDFLLLTNSARGVMKIEADSIDKDEAITEPVKGGGIAGTKYETVKELTGIVQLDKFGDAKAVVLVQKEMGSPLDLKTIDLP